MLTAELYARGRGVAAAAGPPRVAQRVEHEPLLLAQPGHDRHRKCGEHHFLLVADHAPGDLAAEPVLGLPGDLDPLLPRVLAEPAAGALDPGGAPPPPRAPRGGGRP